MSYKKRRLITNKKLKWNAKRAQLLSFNLIHHVCINADMQNHVYLTTTPKLCLVDKCKGDLYNNVLVTSIKCSLVK